MNTSVSPYLASTVSQGRPRFSAHLAWSVALTLLLGILMMMPDTVLFRSAADYLTFHNLFELLSIGVASAIGEG